MRNDIGMRLHTTNLSMERVTEFHKWAYEARYEIGVSETSKEDGTDKIRTLTLDKREAKALRHWLYAALSE